jgi:hypothetical protein
MKKKERGKEASARSAQRFDLESKHTTHIYKNARALIQK